MSRASEVSPSARRLGTFSQKSHEKKMDIARHMFDGLLAVAVGCMFFAPADFALPLFLLGTLALVSVSMWAYWADEAYCHNRTTTSDPEGETIYAH